MNTMLRWKVNRRWLHGNETAFHRARTQYPEDVNSHQAALNYAQPLPTGSARLCLDLFPAIPSSYGTQHDAFVSGFRLQETREVSGLVSLRAEALLPDLLAFLGGSWKEALARWPELAAMAAYRQEHGNDAYASLDQWQQFYQLLDDGIAPERIELASLEEC